MGTLLEQMLRADEDQLGRDEVLLASAVQFLVDGGEGDAATALLACSLSFEETGYGWASGDCYYTGVHATLACPRIVFDLLQDKEGPIYQAIWRSLQAILPYGRCLTEIFLTARLVTIPPGWQKDLLELARGKGIRNQATWGQTAVIWKGLRFRSKSEVRIADALERAGVWFLPNNVGRLTTSEGRCLREADFLVIYEGKVGVLEVDGEPFHPPTRAAYDHDIARDYRLQGIRVVERYDAKECYGTPDAVVAEFLQLLRQS